MNTSHGRMKRLHAEFRGDEAVEIDMLEVILRMGEISRTRIESDTRLVRLALKALNNAITDYCRKSGQRYPNYVSVMKYLDDAEDAAQAGSTRVINLPSATGSREQGS
jgi:hypothetical protein